jgi:LacI family transcriptional regulator
MKRVALLIETSRAYGRDLLLGVRRYITEHEPWSVFVEVRDLDSSPPRWLRDWDGDGILTRSGSQAIIDAVSAAGVPAVELRANRPDHPFPFVGIDNDAVGRWCADYLAELGFRSYGVYGLTTERFFEVRRASFMNAVEERGFECRSLELSLKHEKPGQWERHQRAVVKWLKELPKPTAVLACTDQLGFWLLDACLRANIAVPEEVAVLGVENDETLCEMSVPPLTSMRLAGEQVGYEAAKLLDRLMKGGKPPKTSLLLKPLGIISRKSTDTVAINDKLLSQAIRLIREKASEGVRVKDVLKSVPLSRSTLERSFREVLGRSPTAEINRVRLGEAKRFLDDSDMTLEQIAMRTGYSSVQYFTHAFRLMFGCTPGGYRKRRKKGDKKT